MVKISLVPTRKEIAPVVDMCELGVSAQATNPLAIGGSPYPEGRELSRNGVE